MAGWTRAGTLAVLLAPAHGDPHIGLVRPTAVWATDVRGDEGQRSQQTVAPLAARLRIAVDTRFSKGQTGALAAALVGAHGVTLVSWQHEESPAIAAG